MIQSALIFASIQWGAAATPPIAVPDETVAKVTKLLEQLPSQHVMRNCQMLVTNPPGKASDPNGERVAAARKMVAKVQEIIPELRKHLKVGTSVFSYPGLLAHGEILYLGLWDEDPFAANPRLEMGYRLRMGLPIGYSDHRFEFEVVFDSSGIIRRFAEVESKE